VLNVVKFDPISSQNTSKKGPIRVFIGTDESQRVVSQVLEHSIRKFSTRPVEINLMSDISIPSPKKKENQPMTPFSFYRFLIPRLAGYKGRAIYLDADMQVFGDIAELWDTPMGNHKVLCAVQNETLTAWGRNSSFQTGRQMSVLLMDCSKLDWRIEDIIQDLDQDRYTYAELVFNLCLLKSDEIGETIPPEWNSLEAYVPDRTKLLHYTVGHIQPWRNNRNSLRHIWMDAFLEAAQQKKILEGSIAEDIASGYLKPSLINPLKGSGNRSFVYLVFSYWINRIKHAVKKRSERLFR